MNRCDHKRQKHPFQEIPSQGNSDLLIRAVNLLPLQSFIIGIIWLRKNLGFLWFLSRYHKSLEVTPRNATRGSAYYFKRLHALELSFSRCCLLTKAIDCSCNICICIVFKQTNLTMPINANTIYQNTTPQRILDSR